MAQTENIKAAKLKEWLDNKEAVLIDVREPDEYRYEHIEGALNIPLSTIGARTLPLAWDKRIVVQCGTGARSAQACGKLSTEQTLYNLEGGLQEWKQAGLNVVRAEKAALPIMRQVQIVVGFFVLLGVALGWFLHPVFLLIPAAMGAGLLNAGLTGWCGMAKLLSGMPWNKENSTK